MEDLSPHEAVLETYLESVTEDQSLAPELTEGGRAVSELRHAEAQLRRLLSDARRTESSVRRELARAVAEARTPLGAGA